MCTINIAGTYTYFLSINSPVLLLITLEFLLISGVYHETYNWQLVNLSHKSVLHYVLFIVFSEELKLFYVSLNLLKNHLVTVFMVEIKKVSSVDNFVFIFLFKPWVWIDIV